MSRFPEAAVLVLGLACFLAPDLSRRAMAVEARPAAQEPAIPARIATARNKTGANAKDRADEIRALGHLTEARELRDQQVIEVLCRIAEDKADNLIVRMEAMSALGKLQRDVFADDFPRARYAMPFTGTLKDVTEDEFLRAKAAEVLGRTMPPDNPQTRQVSGLMSVTARNRAETLLLRVACVEGLAQLGAVDELMDLLATVLPQPDLDPLLQKRLLKSFAEVLAHAEFDRPIPLPTLIRIRELAFNQATPVELRAICIRTLARLKKAQYAKSVDLMPEIKMILKKEEDARLIVAAVEAIGILDEADAVPSLADAYQGFYDAQKADREADVKIRLAIVRTLGDLLAAQDGRKTPDGEAIRRAVELLLKAIDPAKENLEVASVRENAIFALRYLYSKKPEFKRFQQATAERLMALLRERSQAGGELPAAVVDTLKYVSRYPGENDLNQWEKWYSKTYPRPDLVKSEER